MQTEENKHMGCHGQKDDVNIFVADTVPMRAGEWTQFTFTYDGSPCVFYKNGKPVVKGKSEAIIGRKLILNP